MLFDCIVNDPLSDPEMPPFDFKPQPYTVRHSLIPMPFCVRHGLIPMPFCVWSHPHAILCKALFTVYMWQPAGHRGPSSTTIICTHTHTHTHTQNTCIYPYQGISYERTRDIRKEHLNPGISTYYQKPVLIHQVQAD